MWGVCSFRGSDHGDVAHDLERFLSSHAISKDQIVSITQSETTHAVTLVLVYIKR